MPFSIRPYRRFPVLCAVTYHGTVSHVATARVGDRLTL
jgi:hypothetical protein